MSLPLSAAPQTGVLQPCPVALPLLAWYPLVLQAVASPQWESCVLGTHVWECELVACASLARDVPTSLSSYFPGGFVGAAPDAGHGRQRVCFPLNTEKVRANLR